MRSDELFPGFDTDAPPVVADEATTLSWFLDRQRMTFQWKTGGLDAAALRTAHAPSPMTLGGMILHLTRFEDDMSSEWLHAEPQLPRWAAIDWDATPGWDWEHGAALSPDELYAGWDAAVVRSRERFRTALAEGGPDRQAPLPDGAGWTMPTARYILLNMIEEYARHNGQADLIRETIDGLTGHDPPG